MFAHSKIVTEKQKLRADIIDSLPKDFHAPLNAQDKEILNLSVSSLNYEVLNGNVKPQSVVLAYGKRAIEAQGLNNPLTEIMLKEAYSDFTLNDNKKGPLYGVPVSLKDMYPVKGYDVSLGYSSRCFQPALDDMPLVKIIKEAGGIPYVKTNVPLSMLSFECFNDVFGFTQNPHLKGYSPGGSSGGEASLIAYGGSRIGVGSDVAGSVRLPAHFCGIYALRPTTTRFPRSGAGSAIPGQEGIPSVNGPMARSLEDLSYFFKAIIDMKPWDFDYQVTEMPFKKVELPKKITFGIIKTDGIVDPSPACARALRLSVEALKRQGHDVVDFNLKNSLEILEVGSQLLCSDGLEVSTNMMQFGEHFDSGVYTGWLWNYLPKWLKRLCAFYVEKVKKDKTWATLLRGFGKKTVAEQWALVARREKLRSEFFSSYMESGIDFILSVPNATPSFPHGGLKNCWASCLYTFLENVMDYPSGVIPVTKVDRTIDALKYEGRNNWNKIQQGAYLNYNAEKMHGLPVGIQITGKRFHEEHVLKAMEVLENALRKNGVVYQQIEI